MDRRSTSRRSNVGYLIVLLGVAGWVVSCFLPLYRIPDLGEGSISLYRQLALGFTSGLIGIKVGSLLSLFGAVAAIGVISILGILRPRPWGGAALAGAAIAWFLATIGMLISLGSASSLNPGMSLAVGYWSLWLSAACVSAGTVIVLISPRRQHAQEGGVVRPDEHRDPLGVNGGG